MKFLNQFFLFIILTTCLFGDENNNSSLNNNWYTKYNEHYSKLLEKNKNHVTWEDKRHKEGEVKRFDNRNNQINNDFKQQQEEMNNARMAYPVR